jgi:lactate dehydrogenase-like 2-hydroxyacid dehydrogenase
MRIVVTRRPPGDALDMLRSAGQVWLWKEDRSIPREVLEDQVTRANALYSMINDRIDAPLLDMAHRLVVISNMGVGVDNIDREVCRDRGIPVGNTPDVLTETTADTAFGLLIAAARRFRGGLEYVRRGKWGPWEPRLMWGHDVHGSTLGLIGFGRIGRALARRANGFRMNVLYTARHRQALAEADLGAHYVTFKELLRESDHVIVAAPLTDETRGLIDAAALRAMKPTATLINIARGAIVDSEALVVALRTGEIAAAGLDVIDPEPPPADHTLLHLENCFVLPHLGSSTERTRAAMAELAATNVIAGLRGEPLAAEVPPPPASGGAGDRRSLAG